MNDEKFIIASYAHVMQGEFTTLGGPALALRNYLKTRIAKLMCIWQPLSISDALDALAEVYESNTLHVYHLPVPNWPWDREGGINLLYVMLKPRDILADVYFALRLRDRYDYWIGVESLNALVGVAWRRARLVKYVIYYNLDYGEVRFRNTILNRIFHVLDRLAARHADVVWNLSSEMARTRSRLADNELKFAPQLTVPIGTKVDSVRRVPVEQLDRNAIVFLGLLSEHTGALLTIEAMPAILQKIPEVKLLVVGSGPLDKDMQICVEQLGLSASVKFLGRVSDKRVEEILCQCAIGIAPYAPDPDSIKKFTDVTKPRMYMACGLPVVITAVPPIAKEIADNGAGIVIEYDKGQLADAVVRILHDDGLFRELKANAARLAARYDWDDIFTRAWAETINVVEGPHAK